MMPQILPNRFSAASLRLESAAHSKAAPDHCEHDGAKDRLVGSIK
jgi:hypothetical protein